MTDETAANPRDVFVVHGRNAALRDSMFAFLRALNLHPIEWSIAVAMTESGAPYVGEVLDAAFDRVKAVVVLLTPDEIAYLRPEFAHGEHDPETQPATQARPNVLFEAGMALGRHPRHTILVEVGDLRPFSDVAGRHAIRMTNDAARRQELASRLRTAGCDVVTDGTDWLSTGDFTPPPPPGQGLPLGRRTPSTKAERRLDFDANYHATGGNRGGKLQLVNRGTEAAHDVEVIFPENSALTFLGNAEVIPKIPGGGKSVTLTVWHQGRTLGGPRYSNSFEFSVRCRTVDGEPFEQQVFIDTNER